VYFQCDNDQKSFLVAYDVKSGDERWRVDRDENSNWSTPLVWKNKVRTELVVAGGRRMRSYDPASGVLLWELTAAGRTATTPAGNEEMLFVDSYNRLTGVNGVVAAVRPGGSGDISPPEGEASSEFVAWTLPLAGARSASLLAYDGCVYVLDQGGGVARCLDAATGKLHYRKRIAGASGFVASPWASGGRVYLLDSSGRTSTIEPGPELHVLAASDLGEMCWGSPGVVGNRLLLRTVDSLYCIGQ
jgi:outer membrane protein assembly factor BamB